MRAIYLLGLIAGAVLLFATEDGDSRTEYNRGLLASVMLASSYKLDLFTSNKI